MFRYKIHYYVLIFHQRYFVNKRLPNIIFFLIQIDMLIDKYKMYYYINNYFHTR